jgi:pilus assembly protein FimV
VAKLTGHLYDDDLTVNADEYNEWLSDDYVDLFEPLGDADAPIAKLKPIIVSIEWEITDDILNQLHDELQDLKEVWTGDKINLVYVQGMEAIGRYILREKANAHPNAVKLLFSFYYHLEKIVSSASMSEEEKKNLLLQDVKAFDQFKILINPASHEKKPVGAESVAVHSQGVGSHVEHLLPSSQYQKKVLTNLKTILLGIDWEMNDKEFVRLDEEVTRLQQVLGGSKTKLILLQGIGSLGNYISFAKSGTQPDAFKLLHSFYEGLEKVHQEVLPESQEREILLAEVEKFNDFKAAIAMVSSEVVVPVDEEKGGEAGDVDAAAFADRSETNRDFRTVNEHDESDIDRRIDSFFGDEDVAADHDAATVGDVVALTPEDSGISSRLDSLFGKEEAPLSQEAVSDSVLSGVDVETEADDDSNEKALPFQDGELAPALVEMNGQDLYAGKGSPVTATVTESMGFIPGLDVESEADDDSEELALPCENGKVAPALALSDEDYRICEASLLNDADSEVVDVENRLDEFFGLEIESSSQRSTFVASEASPEALTSIGLAVEDIGGEKTVGIGLSQVEEEESFESEAVDAIYGLDMEDEETEKNDFVLDGIHDLFQLEESTLAANQLTEAAEPGVETLIMEPVAADLIFAEVGSGTPVDKISNRLDVIFEPVGDDVEVDALPPAVFGGVVSGAEVEGEFDKKQESLEGLQACRNAIISKEYEMAFPFLFTEINRLRDNGGFHYTRNSFLQLLEIVGQHIDQYRDEADDDSLILLQSLCYKLEQVSQGQRDFDKGCEQILFTETGKVLSWQQSLISLLITSQGGQKI